MLMLMLLSQVVFGLARRSLNDLLLQTFSIVSHGMPKICHFLSSVISASLSNSRCLRHTTVRFSGGP